MAVSTGCSEGNIASESLESVLRVGQVRLRPYSRVKHAHVILKKVDEEEYVDRWGKRRTRGIFSLFAQKVINVKPGKEIFFSVNDYLEERVVAFEADLQNSDEVDMDVVHSAKSEETVVQRHAHALPPKMRKMWARKETVSVRNDVPISIRQKMTSIGVQTMHTCAAVGIQTSPVYPSVLTQEPSAPSNIGDSHNPLSVPSDVERPPNASVPQTLPLASQTSTALPAEVPNEDALQTASTPTDKPLRSTKNINNETGCIMDNAPSRSSPERSLSPMELESAPNSPEYSPQLLVVDLPTDEDSGGRYSPAELKSSTGNLQGESIVTLVESPLLSVKEEPEDFDLSNIPLVPSAPTFSHRSPDPVPDLYSALQQISTSFHAESPRISARPSDTVETAQSRTATPKTSITFNASRVPTPHASNPPSPVSTHRRPPPTFVPATQLSQNFQIASSSVPKPDDSSQELPIFTTSNSTKRKRVQPTASAPVHDPYSGIQEWPSKKWKPVVKLEPRSPELPPLSAPVTSLTYPIASESSHAARKSFSFSPPPALNLSATSLQRTEVPINIKSEPLDPMLLNFHSPVSRAPPHRYSLPKWNSSTNAPLPPKHSGTPLRRFGGGCSSLPVIKKANIKMDTTGRHVGVRAIIFDSTGERFAVICRDKTIRIWDNVSHVEIAKLAHSTFVVSATWIEGSISVASLGANGIVSKWTSVGKNRWMWEKLIDSGYTDPSCLAYYKHRLAVANPHQGVKIWEYQNGEWLPLERGIPRKNILSVKFMNEGNDLLCGSSDGTVFRCTQLSRVQSVATFRTKVFHVDANPSGSLALIAQAFGSVHLVDVTLGRILQDYSLRNAEQQYGGRGSHGFKPLFTDYGDAVVFGAIDGRVLVWDKQRGRIIHEMDHGTDAMVQAVASFDGLDGEQQLVSCTGSGALTWWRLPFRIF